MVGDLLEFPEVLLVLAQNDVLCDLAAAVERDLGADAAQIVPHKLSGIRRSATGVFVFIVAVEDLEVQLKDASDHAQRALATRL